MTTYQITEDQRSLLAAGALATDLSTTPRLLTTLTDEELTALTGAERPGQILPWLDGLRSRVPEYGAQEAVLTGARSLRARGLTAPESTLARLESREIIGETADVRASLVVTGIIARRAVSPRRLTFSHEGEGPTLTVVFSIDSDDSVLQEQVSPDGLHHFLIQDKASAHRALTGLVDEGRAGEDTPATPPSQRFASGPWDELATIFGIRDASSVRRIDLYDRPADAEETLWWARSAAGPVVLRRSEDEEHHEQEETRLDATAVEDGERDELLREMLMVADR